MIITCGLIKHIDSDWDSIFFDAFFQEPNKLVGSELILGTWFIPKDFMLGA